MRADTTLNQTSGIAAGEDLAMQSGNDMTFRRATVARLMKQLGLRDDHGLRSGCT
jgi:hypothetical protein